MAEEALREVLQTCDDIMMLVIFLACFPLFYLSVKKCFWKEGVSRVKLFLLTAVMNPLVVIVISILFTRIVENVVFAILGVQGLEFKDYSIPMIALVSTVMGASYPILVFLSAWILGKWLRVKNLAPVRFICLMCNAIVVFQFRQFGEYGQGGMSATELMFDIVSLFISLSLFLFFYLADVRSLSMVFLEDSGIDWKVFNVPPTIFITLYMASMIPVFYRVDTKIMIVIALFEIVIMFMLAWAFNVIIKNVAATHEAVTAKEEAVVAKDEAVAAKEEAVVAKDEALVAKDEALKAKDEVKTLSVEVMEALAHTIDAKDEYTRGHSVRVAKYSRMLAEKLNLSLEERENVYYMALLHDIGKIGVPNSIINSPTRLTDEEYAVIKTHPGVGFDILAEIKSRPDLTIGARWHHERFDGKGYPDGKAGTDIPFYARIIAVADTYDAMTSNRSYRKYMAQDAVRAEFVKNSGTQFDPDIVKCMLEIIDEDVNYELHE